MNKQRRHFIRQSGAVTAGISLLPAWTWASQKPPTYGGADEILKKLSELNDANIGQLLSRQIHQPGDRWDGGLPDQYELPNVHSTTSLITVLAGAYASKWSGHHRATTLEQALEKAVECLLRVQHEDGTIDLHTTNFHSTPDTAFLVNYLSPAYVCLKRMQEPGLAGFLAKLEQFLQRTAKCLLVGGIHTANHRWVVSSALARIHAFFPDQKLVDRIDEWLAEGIDLDPDGQYHERSAAIYSPICDTMLLTIGRLLHRPELMEVVRRNLRMSLYYIQPGGEVVTHASDRQDRSVIGYVKEYYYAYRYFALLDGNPHFTAVCEMIEDLMPERITHFILLLLEDPIFSKYLGPTGKIPDQYFKQFVHSGLFRIRRGEVDISIIEKNPTFLTYRKGGAVLQSMRLAASFFGKGQFEAQETEFDGKTIILKWSFTAPYYQPVPPEHRSGENDWEKYERAQRPLSEVQTLRMTVTIREDAGKVAVEAEVAGTEHVPVAWELSFRLGGKLSGVAADPLVANAFYLEKGIGSYQMGNDVIRFGEGAVTHRWSQMRGTLPKQEGDSVYITGYTPFRKTIHLE